MEESLLPGEGLQTLTYARQLWPLSIEGSLGCHTYCDAGHPFISEDPTPIAERLAVEMSLTVIRLRFVAAGIRTPKVPLARPTL